MKRIKFTYTILLFVLTIVVCCRDPYNPPVISKNSNYLVVDAFLNSENGATRVKLSRTLPLYSAEPAPKEHNALVEVEEENGSRYALEETSDGLYTLETLPVSMQKKYRIHIRTQDQQEFFSQYITLKNSPDIDSIYWQAQDDGIEIYVDTHDPSGDTRYYKWDYTETWQYTSVHSSSLKLIDGEVFQRLPSEYIHTCWKDHASTSILAGSSVRLQQDVISHFPLIFIPKASSKYTIKYSVLVQQKALTEEAYNYWTQLERTTESLGGLFDPMPSEVTGNFYNATHPGEPVLGFFSGCSVREKRIFIGFYDLPDNLQVVPSRMFCEIDTIDVQDIHRYGNSTLLIGSFGSPFPVGYTTSTSGCIDCRLQGGTTVKPLFWE